MNSDNLIIILKNVIGNRGITAKIRTPIIEEAAFIMGACLVGCIPMGLLQFFLCQGINPRLSNCVPILDRFLCYVSCVPITRDIQGHGAEKQCSNQGNSVLASESSAQAKAPRFAHNQLVALRLARYLHRQPSNFGADESRHRIWFDQHEHYDDCCLQLDRLR